MADSMVHTTEVRKTSPLDGMVAPVAGDVRMCERQFVGKINLRGNGGSKEFATAVREVLGMDLPRTPNTTASRTDGKTVFWLGPDEWLVHTPENTQTDLVARLRTALGGIHSAVTDVTDYYVVIELQGIGCREVMARGCALDLHPRTFHPGQCAQSQFAYAPVLIHMVDDNCIGLQVRWTYAQYLWQYLSEAAENLAAR